MKIAIQLAGQIRMWDNAYSEWETIKSKLESNNIDVDIHICTWKDEYTETLGLKTYQYSHMFTTINLIPIKQELFSEIGKETKDFEKNRGYSPHGMMPVSYQYYYGGRFRRLYQRENNIQYDVIILSRPDVYFKDIDKTIEYLVNQNGVTPNYYTTLEAINSQNSTIYIPQGEINSVHKNNHSTQLDWMSDDLFVMGNEHSINQYCNGYLHCFLQNSHSFVATNHTYPVITCHKSNLRIKELNLGPNLWRPGEKRKYLS
tara:strand:- start:699 stop:1475 length:777 start_codon:yes stop_codon:yes gene_type:complete